jgi:hypothetical protein
VQEQLKRDHLVRQSHEFAFTKLMACGLCGSGISAEEKYKQLKDGTVTKYIYYGCSRARDRSCRNQYLREEELVEQLAKILDRIDLNQTGIQRKLEDELRRYRKFNSGVLGTKADATTAGREVDLRTYAKYILREGTNEEKRELMGCLKTKLILTEKKLSLGPASAQP